jgi:pyrimidine deaminase RibD-like protein
MAAVDTEEKGEDVHQQYMRLALAEARKSPPKPTNFCVGACLVSPSSTPALLTTGYTLECEGNTHAEQSCFIKLSAHYKCEESELGQYLPEDTVLYTTMEPCNKRSVGNTPCVDGILGLNRRDGGQAVGSVYVGVSEPETFVGVNEGKRKLEDAGIQVIHVPGLEEEILAVATAGHQKPGNNG